MNKDTNKTSKNIVTKIHLFPSFVQLWGKPNGFWEPEKSLNQKIYSAYFLKILSGRPEKPRFRIFIDPQNSKQNLLFLKFSTSPLIYNLYYNPEKAPSSTDQIILHQTTYLSSIQDRQSYSWSLIWFYWSHFSFPTLQNFLFTPHKSLQNLSIPILKTLIKNFSYRERSYKRFSSWKGQRDHKTEPEKKELLGPVRFYCRRWWIRDR